MLNYRSVRSSEPQIRSNPALKHCSTAFQKNAQTLLEDIQPTFPTYGRLLTKHETILKKHCFYAWKRPAHLRSQWILIDPSLPTILIDCKNHQNMHVLRIPSRALALQKVGTILCEGSWDAQEHILWIWDIVYWNRQNVWQSEPFSKRWEILKGVVSDILDVGHPMSDAEVMLPTFETIQNLCKQDTIDSSFAVEFQPEKEGQRRLFFFESVPKQLHKPKPAEKSVEKSVQKIVKPVVQIEETSISAPAPVQVAESVEPVKLVKKVKQETQEKKQEKRLQKVSLIKDTAKAPDTYRIQHNGTDYGLLAVRSLDMSRKLRDLFAKRGHCSADVEWFEPFQKYELKQLYFS